MTHTKSVLFLQLSELQQAARVGRRRGKDTGLTSCKRNKTQHICLQTRATAKLLQEVSRNCPYWHPESCSLSPFLLPCNYLSVSVPVTLQRPGKELSEVESHTYHADRHPLLRGSGGVRFVLLQDTRAQLLQKLQRTKSKEVFIRDDSRTMELQNLHPALHPLTQGTKMKDSVLVWTVLSLLVLK